MEGRGDLKRIELKDFGGNRRINEEDSMWKHLGFSSRSRGSGDIIDRVKKFRDLNNRRLNNLSVELKPGSDVGAYVDFVSKDRIGSLPLRSLSTRMADTVISVKPRFGWEDISTTLEILEWNVPIEFYPDLESVTGLSKVPAWTLAGEVLRSIEDTLDRPAIAHNYDEKAQSKPKGEIDWAKYSRNQFPKGKKHRVPCRYPVLSMDSPAHRYFKGITQYLKDELGSTENVTSAKEQKKADKILRTLRGIPAEFPTLKDIDSLPERGPWKRYREAYRRCRWIILSRGMGSGSTGYGIPWSVKMDDLYERWVTEGIRRWARSRGGKLSSTSEGSSSRKRISWNSHRGSLKSLCPDVIAKIEEEAVIFDAKYKRHYQLLRWRGWNQMKESYSKEAEDHRADVHQVLSYSAAVGENNFCFLVYPVDSDWYLEDYDRSFQTVGDIGGKLKLGLIPFPLGGKKVLKMFHRTLDEIYENR